MSQKRLRKKRKDWDARSFITAGPNTNLIRRYSNHVFTPGPLISSGRTKSEWLELKVSTSLPELSRMLCRLDTRGYQAALLQYI